MKQQLVLFKHEKLKLFYVGVYNSNKNLESSSSITTNYSRAKYLLGQMQNGELPSGLKSGFMISLINTDFDGWTSEILNEIYENPVSAATAKDNFIITFEDLNEGYVFIGSGRHFVKSSGITTSGSPNWTSKWNLNSMTMDKIRSKIEFIIQSIDLPIPESIFKDAYMSIVVDGYMARRHNFKSYEINDLVSLFRYVRNYIGKDLNGIGGQQAS